jgi:F-type H+-transporting ATPase subunit b
MDINATLLGQAITFAILIIFTMKFIWPPLNKILEERANRIATGLAAAELGRKELNDSKQQVTAELQRVQLRATEIIANAQKMSTQIIEEAKQKAAEEHKKIINDGEMQVKHELLRAKEQLQLQVTNLAIAGAEKILQAEIDKSRHQEILKEIITKL